jgi:sec-independent protein translocase protein TatB
MGAVRKARTVAVGAQEQLHREIGSELAELRRQVADLQSLKEIQDLRALRDLDPKRLIGQQILGDDFTSGFAGFLGSTDPSGTGAAGAAANGTAGAAETPPAVGARPRFDADGT